MVYTRRTAHLYMRRVKGNGRIRLSSCKKLFAKQIFHSFQHTILPLIGNPRTDTEEVLLVTLTLVGARPDPRYWHAVEQLLP